VTVEELQKFSKTLTLLYVEDNADTRVMTEVLLREYFDTIITASNGKEGLEKFTAEDIDIVITDINMAQMDGLSMAREIKAIDENIPVLIFSAYNDSESFMEAIKIGIDGYLVKPIDMEQIYHTLNRALKAVKAQKENEAYKKELQKKVEEQLAILRQKDEMLVEQSRFAAMGEMIDIIAHQWKQPLHTIIMHASLIESYLKEDAEVPKEELESFLQNIDQKVSYLLETLQEFRSFLRPNTTKQHVALRDAIRSALLLLKDELTLHGVDIRVECMENVYIYAYHNDIKQLLINTITNAKEAMIAQEIPKSQRVITLRCHSLEEGICLEVRDSGKGIPEDIIDKIFTMNFTTKENSGGTGIGLYMCALIAQKHNATIKAYNDNGAVIQICFKKQSA